MKIIKKKLTTVIIIFLLGIAHLNATTQATAFIITGEQSGEELASWYVRKVSLDQTHKISILASQQMAEKILASPLKGFDELKQVNILRGVGPLVWGLMSKHMLYRKLIKTIVAAAPDQLILVDFPWINLRLARAVKKMLPATRIIYIAPPELWFWGCWGIDSYLRDYCNECIVLYPQEQDWYAQRKLATRWLGYPYEDEFYHYLNRDVVPTNAIALLPGSRESEVSKTLPLMCEALVRCKVLEHIKICVIQAASISEKIIYEIVMRYGLQDKVTILRQDDREQLSRCFYALTKPGTVTLHLALLGVPHAVIFKGSWLTSMVLSHIIKPKALGLPNLLSTKAVGEEFIQEHLTPEVLAAHTDAVFFAFQNNDESYKLRQNKVNSFRKAFISYGKTTPQARAICCRSI